MQPTQRQMAGVRRSMLSWYAAGHRDFPWRHTSDPYAVLVSEVMLQQTQASRVVPRWERFMARFPTATALADASDADVLAEWSGLGYNRRALALRRTARIVAERGWPREIAGLEGLPGVGPYTARALASLAFGQPTGVVDTNVRRWLRRRYAADDRPRMLQQLADSLAAGATSADQARAWTHASMEFGALICRAAVPRCGACPIARGCPSRDRAQRVPVAAQPPFAGSRRATRGAVLRCIAAAPGRRLLDFEARRIAGAALGDAEWATVVAALDRDGLLHRAGEWLALGRRVAGSDTRDE